VKREILKKFILTILFFISISISTGLVFAKDNTEPPAMPLLPMVRAMGGAFTAIANDENAVFYNPAGYATIDDGIISVFSLGIKANIDDSALKLYNALISGKDITSSDNINDYLSNTKIAAGISGPIYFGRVGNNFGFAFYDNTDVFLSTRPGSILPTGDLNLYGDLGFVGGYGLPLPFLNNLYAGFNLKVLLRVKSSVNGTILGIIDTVSDTSNLPIAKAVGFGGDLGILYFPLTWCSFGLAAKDFFGTHFDNWENLSNSKETFPRSYIKPRISFGVAIYPLKTISESKESDNLLIALDYSDILDYSSIFSNIKFGVAFKTLRIIDLRGGIDGGYICGGIGFDLKIFHINLAYFVDERGTYPGANPFQNLVLNLALRW